MVAEENESEKHSGLVIVPIGETALEAATVFVRDTQFHVSIEPPREANGKELGRAVESPYLATSIKSAEWDDFIVLVSETSIEDVRKWLDCNVNDTSRYTVIHCFEQADTPFQDIRNETNLCVIQVDPSIVETIGVEQSLRAVLDSLLGGICSEKSSLGVDYSDICTVLEAGRSGYFTACFEEHSGCHGDLDGWFYMFREKLSDCNGLLVNMFMHRSDFGLDDFDSLGRRIEDCVGESAVVAVAAPGYIPLCKKKWFSMIIVS